MCSEAEVSVAWLLLVVITAELEKPFEVGFRTLQIPGAWQPPALKGSSADSSIKLLSVHFVCTKRLPEGWMRERA